MWVNVFFFLCMLLFFICVFLLFNRDIFSPTVMVSAIFSVCSFLFLLNTDKWQTELDIRTILIVFWGLSIFAATEFFFCAKRKNCQIAEVTFSCIKIDKWKLYFLLIMSLVVTLLYYKEIQRIYFNFGIQYGSNIMQVYRMLTAHSNLLSSDQMVNPILIQLMKVSMVSAYICIYVFINNVFCCNDKIKNNFFYLVFCGVYIVESLMSGGRVQILYFLVASMVIFYVKWKQKVRWKKNISLKFIFIGIAAMILFGVVFYNIRFWVGRSKDTLNILDYISVYAAAPLCLLDNFIKEGSGSPLYFGEETFVGIRTFLYKIGLVDTYRSIQLEFGYANGYALGNLYTFFRRPIYDFGVIGMSLVTMTFSAVYSKAYYTVVAQTNVKKKWGEIGIIMYAMWFYPVVLFPLDNCLYQLVTIGNIVTCVLCVVMDVFLLHTKIYFWPRRISGSR